MWLSLGVCGGGGLFRRKLSSTDEKDANTILGQKVRKQTHRESVGS